MNNKFSICSQCRDFKELAYKTPMDSKNQWEGVCNCRKFRKRFHVNKSSESCPSGSLAEGLAPDSITPDKPINRGDFFE